MCAQHGHLAGVRIGRTGFGEIVVAVVPHHHQTQIGHRGEHRGSGTDNHGRISTQYRQPAPIPLRRSEFRRKRDNTRCANMFHTLGGQRIDIALIRDDCQHSPAGAGCGHRRLGEASTPGLTGQRLPHRACGAALRQCLEKTLATLVTSPARAVDRWGLEVIGGRRASFLLGPRMAWRQGESQHVGAGSRISGRHRVNEPAHIRRQHPRR